MDEKGRMVWDKGRDIESKCGSLGMIRIFLECHREREEARGDFWNE